MAYKKYIKRNGKVYGPYLYESERINGKVVSKYHGPKKKKWLKKILIISGMILVLALIIYLLIVYGSKLTGQVATPFEPNYIKDQISPQKINLEMKEGELIPSDTILKIGNKGKLYELTLSEVVSENVQEGDYYLEQAKVSGSGEGFGFPGSISNSETVFFKIKLTEVNSENQETSKKDTETATPNETIPEENFSINNEENQTGINKKTATPNETIPEENFSINNEENQTGINKKTATPNETIEETPKSSENVENLESPKETTENNQEQVPEKESSKTATSAPLTGNVISVTLGSVSKFFVGMFTGKVINNEEIQADVSIDNPFTYKIPVGFKASLIPGSVKTNSKQLSDSEIQILEKDGVLTATTNYKSSEKGFGKKYLSEKTKTIEIDLSQKDIYLERGEVKITFLNEGKEIFTQTKFLASKNETQTEKQSKKITDYMQELINKTIKELAQNQYSGIPTLTSSEKKIIRDKFGFIAVKSEASEYRDKIKVEFSLENHKIEHYYSSNLTNEELKKAIQRDRVIWLKDLAREFSSTKETETKKPELDELYPII